MLGRHYLDKSFDILLKPEKRQLMLDKFCALPEYARLLDGQTLIEVYTQDKVMLEGTLTLKAHERVVFTCLTPGMPKFQKGNLLLFVPQKTPQLVLVQVSVDTVVDNYVMVEAVDPRRRARFRTRMAASLYGVNATMFDHIKTHAARVFRENEQIRPMGGIPYVGRALDKVEDHAKITHDGMQFVGKGRAPHKAILADISEGGCCLFVHRDAKIEGLHENKLIFVMLELPHPTKTIQARVFASVRLVRKEHDHVILHAMFVDALPQQFLQF